MQSNVSEVAELAVDFYERLIQMPPPLWVATHPHDPSLPDPRGEHRAKPVPPETDDLVK
jgi:hypothetical protein